MLVRSSKYFEALVAARNAEVTAAAAITTAKVRKLEIQRLQREVQESKDDYLNRLLFKNVIAHLHRPEMSVEGLLSAVYNDSIIIRHARVTIDAIGNVEQLEGEQIIPTSNISFVQDLTSSVRT